MTGITVITICFNNLNDLQKTCASVDSQERKPEEHWIINGSSTTEIAGWLESTPQPAYRKWLNERDKGISDAFNKGIQRASYSIIHLLHAGDCYASDQVIGLVDQYFSRHSDTCWISGNIRITRGGVPVTVGKPFDKKKLYRGMRSVAHPTWFVKKAVYDRVGLFNTHLKIGMDYDLMCRIYNEPYGYINETLAVFDDTGISTTNYLASLKENIQVYESHFGYSLLCRLWQFRLKLLHLLLETSFGKWLFRIKNKLGLANA
ncbi:MAG: glycosyltransferase [Sediminibacterium sp.]|nr:glycosyltransferase [Sediminibacterium sp.]